MSSHRGVMRKTSQPRDPDRPAPFWRRPFHPATECDNVGLWQGGEGGESHGKSAGCTEPLLCGDRDRFFPTDVVEETVRLIPDCTLVLYEGQGHMKVATTRRVAHDVLAFVNRN